MSILVIGIIQLLFLIIAVHMIVFFKVCYNIRFSATDILLLVIQVFNLALLTRYVIKDEWFYLTAGLNLNLLPIFQYVFLSILLIRFIRSFRKARMRRLKLLTPQSIRETIDFLPGGICFSTPSGRPILTNHRMNELVYRLTNQTIINAQTTWEELRQFLPANGCMKLDEPWISQDDDDESVNEYMIFSFPDGNIWRFQKEELTDQIPESVQLEAINISDLYQSSKELYKTKIILAEQSERWMNYLENVSQYNHEKEILSTKRRIHADLGECIITTKQHINNTTLSENVSKLTKIWENAIRNLEDVTSIHIDEDISPENDLQIAADTIGCQIHYIGDRPLNRRPTRLLYTAVREALTNAVKHANADQLTVTIRPSNRGYHVTITDNGTIQISNLVEGSGLGDLRKKLEQEGATLNIECIDGVVLEVELPAK
jgi:signal transduction histidine kinase